MNKYEKFSLIAITALAPFFAIQSPLVQQKIDSVSYENTEKTIIQNVEDFRWNNLKEVALEGIDEKSYDGKRVKETLNGLNTKDYKEKLKSKEFYDLELQAFKDTKSEIVATQKRLEKIKPPPGWKFEEEKSDPVVIDLRKEVGDKSEQVSEQNSEPSIKSAPLSMESVHEARQKMREKFLNTTKDVSQKFNKI